MTDTPALFQDVREMIAEFQRADVEFVLVGGHAVAAHGHVRATQDVDLFVRPSGANARRVVAALEAWGAPLATHGVSSADFSAPGAVYQVGVPPFRIDVLTRLDGVTFEEAIVDALVVEVDGTECPVIGRAALIANKRASGRLKDLADVEALLADTFE